MALGQNDLIEIMIEAARVEVPKAAMERAYKAIFATIADEIANGRSITISKFGSFSSVDTKERQGRNPMTGEKVMIPAGRKAKFKASEVLKSKISESK